MNVLKTARLSIDRFCLDDASFIVQLLNEPSFLCCIGDKGVRGLDDARKYLREGPIASYEARGFGLWRVALRSTNTSIGMCGLLKREELDAVDLGFAFLPAYWQRGYAVESASAILALGKKTWGLQRVVAITRPDNSRSIKTLKTLGFIMEGVTCLGKDDNLALYAL